MAIAVEGQVVEGKMLNLKRQIVLEFLIVGLTNSLQTQWEGSLEERVQAPEYE